MKIELISKIFFLVFLSCIGSRLSSQTNFAKDSNLTPAQINLISNYIYQFPDQTQLSIALINGDKVQYIGIKKTDGQLFAINNRDSVFEIGSITKVFTSTILSSLVFDSILSLDESIDGILPYNLNQSSKDGKSITFKTLANHTSGLPFEPDNIEISANKNPDNPYSEYSYDLLNDYLKNKEELISIPGKAYHYSNLGFGLLGYLLELKSKLDYETLLQERVFLKYKMNNSTSEYGKVNNLIVNGLDSCGNILPYWYCNSLEASGGILSNTVDLSRFVISNFSDDPVLDLQRIITYSIMNNHTALGWEIFDIGGGPCSSKWYYKTGGMGGYTSAIIMDTNTQLGLVILSNISSYHKNENTIQLGVEVLRNMYITSMENKTNECIAPFLELALKNGWGSDRNDEIVDVTESATSIVGVWQMPSDFRAEIGITKVTRTFFPDGKVQSDFMGDPEIDVWGYYKIKGDEIIYEDVGGKACKSKGTYKFAIINDRLTFILIDDSCEGRVKGLSGTWRRKK